MTRWQGMASVPSSVLALKTRRTAFGLLHFDADRRRRVAAFELAVLDRRQHEGQVTFLAARELLVAVDEDDAILLGERQRVLDGGIARADDQDRLVLVFLGVVQLILHDAQVLARRAQLAQVALQSDGEHDMFRDDGVALGELQRERALLPGDGGDAGAVADVDLVLRKFLVPRADDLLARPGGERHRAAQRQHRRLGHHVLALLVFVDRVGGVLLGLEQHVRDAQLGRVRRGRQAARSGAYDGDLDGIGHG